MLPFFMSRSPNGSQKWDKSSGYFGGGTQTGLQVYIDTQV